jgi:hypothetical protein
MNGLLQISTAKKNSTQSAGEELHREVSGGLLYCHDRANANTTKMLEVTAFAYALIEVLMQKGLLTEAELNEKKNEVAVRLVEKFKDEAMGVMMQKPELDKYEFQGAPPIDCESRMPICRAACCRLRVALSKQDLEEGIMKWDLAHPYLIARGEDGYCSHLDREGCGCTVYENRPVPCRGYNCRTDQRIWADFENRIPSPQLEKLFTQ